MPKIHFYEKGEGQSLVFIHGFCETSEMWHPFAEEFSKSFRVICPDIPGFGNSTLESKQISLEEVAVLLEEWMEENEIHFPFIFGHSLGGYIALAILELMGAKIKGIGLIHSTSLADDEEKKLTRNKTIQFIKKQGVDNFVTAFVPQLFTPSTRDIFRVEIALAVSQAKKSTLRGLVAFSEAMRDRKSRLDFLKEFNGPKLLIAGTEDGAVKIASSRIQKDVFSDYYELEGAGHMGQVERKKEVIEILSSFMKD